MNSRLTRELCLFAALGLASQLLLLRWLPIATNSSQSLLTCFTFALVCQQLWQLRDSNRRDAAAPLLDNLGWPNRLTALRGWLSAVIAGFALNDKHNALAACVPALCYSSAVLLDAGDGWLARRTHSITLLGSQLDTRMDALGVLVATVVAVHYDKLPLLCLLAGAAYYCFIAGLWWRKRCGLPVLPLPPSKLRRALAGTQMTVVAFSLWPQVDAAWSQPLGLVITLPFLAHFVYDWLGVNARR